MNGKSIGIVGAIVIAQKRNIVDGRLPSHVVMRTMFCLKFHGLSQQRVKAARWKHDAGGKERL